MIGIRRRIEYLVAISLIKGSIYNDFQKALGYAA